MYTEIKKINKEHQRKALAMAPFGGRGPIGYDSDFKFLKIGDSVIVVKEEEHREGNPQFAFCGKGKEGIVLHQADPDFATNFKLMILFPDGEKVASTDYFLQKKKTYLPK